MKIHSMTTVIMGSQHYAGAQKTLSKAHRGDPVDLRPEPANKFDHNAVEIFLHNTKVGYIARADAPRVKAIVERGLLEDAHLQITPTVEVRWRDPNVTEEEEQVLALATAR